MAEDEGYLCTSPLADVGLTPQYKGGGAREVAHWEDFNAHVRLLDAASDHMHVWMVNIYRGTSFGSVFEEYAKVGPSPCRRTRTHTRTRECYPSPKPTLASTPPLALALALALAFARRERVTRSA